MLLKMLIKTTCAICNLEISRMLLCFNFRKLISYCIMLTIDRKK